MDEVLEAGVRVGTMSVWTIGTKWHSPELIILKDNVEYAITKDIKSARDIVSAMHEWEALIAREKDLREMNK